MISATKKLRFLCKGGRVCKGDIVSVFDAASGMQFLRVEHVWGSHIICRVISGDDLNGVLPKDVSLFPEN